MSGHDVHRDAMFDEDPMLTAFTRDLQDAAAVTPAPAIGASLAAVLEGRAPATVYPEVVETPRARVVRRPALLRWAVGATACTLGFGSLGVAGALPGPVQRQVSRMAGVIGVDVPDGDDAAPKTRPSPPSTTSTSTTTTTISPPVGTTLLGDDPHAGEGDPREPSSPEGEVDDEDRREDDDPDEVEDAPDGEDSSGPDPLELDHDGDTSGPHSADADVDVTVDEEGAEDSSGPGSGADDPDGDVDGSGEDPEDDANSSEQP